MNRKVIVNIALFFLLSIYILIIFNIKKYFSIINICFKKNIAVTLKTYIVICSIIALILILLFISIKLLVKNKKDEIKGIKLKIEDGTYGTANWMANEEIEKVLGVISFDEYKF